jgi:hypothetical protein
VNNLCHVYIIQTHQKKVYRYIPLSWDPQRRGRGEEVTGGEIVAEGETEQEGLYN